MEEAGMEKHTGYQRHEGHFEAGVPRQEGRETGRNCGVGEEQSFIGPAWESNLKAELVDKHGDVSEDQRDVDEGIGARRVEVLERDEHGKWPAAEERNKREMKRAGMRLWGSDNVGPKNSLVDR